MTTAIGILIVVLFVVFGGGATTMFLAALINDLFGLLEPIGLWSATLLFLLTSLFVGFVRPNIERGN